MTDAIRFEDVTFRFDRHGPPVLGTDARLALGVAASVPVPAGINLCVARGAVTAILGPNGAGKTTLLHLALGWLRPDNGRVLIDGRPASARSRRELGQTIALVPQFERTPFALSVLDYVLLGRAPFLAPLGAAVQQTPSELLHLFVGGFAEIEVERPSPFEVTLCHVPAGFNDEFPSLQHSPPPFRRPFLFPQVFPVVEVGSRNQDIPVFIDDASRRLDRISRIAVVGVVITARG